MKARVLGLRVGVLLAVCGGAFGGGFPGGVASALAACPPKATTALSTGKLVAAVRPSAAPDNRLIYSMDLNGTNKAAITPGTFTADAYRPRISPDRKSLLFYTGRDDYPNEVALWSMAVDGTGATLIVPPGGWSTTWTRHANAEWSPDGNYVVMEVATATNSNEQVYVLDLCSGTPPTNVKTSTLVSTTQNLIAHHTPSFSHDQGSILYSRCASVSPCRGTDYEIYRMSVFGDALTDTRLTNDGASPRKDLSPIESPDTPATQIAFTRYQGCKAQIYKMGVAGGAITAVVNDSDINLTPSWDRNAAKLYFGRSPNGTQWQLASVPRGGGSATSIGLGTNCGEEFANLSQNSPSAVTSVTAGTALPVDRMVVSVTRTDGPTSADHASNEIYSLKSDGTGQTRLTSDGKGSWWPRLSPNRQKILFYQGGVENYNGASLWVMNWDGTGKTQIIPNTGPPGAAGGAWDTQGHAEWSPDGNYIVMFGANAASGGTLQLWVTSSSGTSPTRISTLNTTISRIDPSWSTDQASIIYTRCPAGVTCTGNRFEVYKQSVFGDSLSDVRLTDDLKRDHDPYMSPDGTEIAFLRQVSCNRWGIFKIPGSPISPPLTSVTTVFDDGAINSLPAWSRDSTKIYFHRLPVVGWESDAYSVNANGTSKTALSTGSDHCNVEDPNATAVSG